MENFNTKSPDIIVQRIAPNILWATKFLMLTDYDDIQCFMLPILQEVFSKGSATFFSMSEEFSPLPFKGTLVRKKVLGGDTFHDFSSCSIEKITKNDLALYTKSILQYSYTNGTGIVDCENVEMQDVAIREIIKAAFLGSIAFPHWKHDDRLFCVSKDIDSCCLVASSNIIDGVITALKVSLNAHNVLYSTNTTIPAIFDADFWAERFQAIKSEVSRP